MPDSILPDSILPDFPMLGTPRDTPLRTLQQAYHFCTRCWMPLAPVRRCRCAPEPYPDGATPARVLAEHPALRTLAARVARGDYARDTATREQRWWEWLRLLYARGVFDE